MLLSLLWRRTGGALAAVGGARSRGAPASWWIQPELAEPLMAKKAKGTKGKRRKKGKTGPPNFSGSSTGGGRRESGSAPRGTGGAHPKLPSVGKVHRVGPDFGSSLRYQRVFNQTAGRLKTPG